jgi:two-component system cell cycle sensor histidine kinase/response regulator CckA
MDAEIKKRIFEPFFTTKEKGKGTGMGLAAVYGVVKGHKGAITFYSEKGHGTTFKLLFPALDECAVLESFEAKSLPGANLNLRILFVDDEENIREMACEMLGSFGHQVVAAENGSKALEIYRSSWQSIDLVILDMIMPEMGGKETYIAMRAVNPRVKALLSSGYSLNGEAQQIIEEGVRGFVQKPFLSAQMQKAIQEAVL